jgi:hypothetical protein
VRVVSRLRRRAETTERPKHLAGRHAEMTEVKPPGNPPADSSAEASGGARYRPLERFWPYPDLSESPDEAELESLDPDLRDELFGPGDRPFSITLVFPRFDGPEYERALDIARAGGEVRETGAGESARVRARFLPASALALRDLFEIVGRFHDTEVLIDDRPLPFARELWLPLVWFLIPR